MRFAAKQGHNFLLLINNFNVVDPGQLALLFDSGGGDQPVPGKRRAKEINAGRRSHRRQPLAVTGVGESGIGKGK